MMIDSTLPSQDAIYEEMLSVIDNTSMGILLYAAPRAALRALDPTGIPLDAFDRLADHPNVVGIKLTQIIRPAAALGTAGTTVSTANSGTMIAGNVRRTAATVPFARCTPDARLRR